MLVLVACTSNETGKAPTSSNNKTISIGTSSAPANFNPIDNTGLGGIDFNVASLMFPPLVDLDNSMKFVPMLADSIDTNDNVTYS